MFSVMRRWSEIPKPELRQPSVSAVAWVEVGRAGDATCPEERHSEGKVAERVQESDPYRQSRVPWIRTQNVGARQVSPTCVY